MGQVSLSQVDRHQIPGATTIILNEFLKRVSRETRQNSFENGMKKVNRRKIRRLVSSTFQVEEMVMTMMKEQLSYRLILVCGLAVVFLTNSNVSLAQEEKEERSIDPVSSLVNGSHVFATSSNE